MSNTTSRATELTKSIDEGLNRLASAIDEQRGAEGVKEYLDTMARFPSYSWRNALLISTQRPQASLVAGFNHWKRLGRKVRKGEKAIRIISPCPVRRATNDDDERVRVFFKAACVFDVSQTEGKELPDVGMPAIQERADRLLAILEEVATSRGISVQYSAMQDGTYGVSKGGKVEIATGHTTGQQSKSLIHELSHEDMHQRSGTGDACGVGRRTAELEAEAVAYVVCRHFDLDVELRASRYIALWGGDGKAIAASLGRISGAARQLIEDVRAVEKSKIDGPAHAVVVPASCRQQTVSATSEELSVVSVIMG